MDMEGPFRFENMENKNFYIMRVQGTDGEQDKVSTTIQMCFQNPIKRLG